MSDEDVVDFKEDLEKEVHPQCEKAWQAYKACEKRIEGKDTGNNCGGTFADYWQCIDKLTAPKIFERLK